MISFKDAIKLWESPLNEIMIGYSALTRKACISPDKIFVIMYWDNEKKTYMYQSFDVGLKKIKGRWMVDRQKIYFAIGEKIKAAEDSNRFGKTDFIINYPVLE